MKHDTFITGLPANGAATTAVVEPTILRFTEPNFVKVFLEEITRPDWRDTLQNRTVTVDGDTGLMTVEQPVHRAFHLVVVDARCLTAGVPRLDPKKVVSAGVAIRRLYRGAWYGWMRQGAQIQGWQAVPPGATDLASVYEPDAALRQVKALGKNAGLLGRLDRLPSAGTALSEDTAPLFPVPPDVAQATGMSLLYGFLPVISGEAEPEDPSAPPPFDLADVAERLPDLFKRPRSGVVLPPVNDNVWAVEMVKPEDASDNTRASGLRTLKSALTWLAQECGAFSGGSQAESIKTALNQVRLVGAARSGLFDFMEYAYQVLILQAWLSTSNTGTVPTSVHMPDAWPLLTSAQVDALTSGALASMTQRWGDMAPLTPRFPAGKRQYQLNCFIRMDDCAGCPPRIVWSAPSSRFRIKPWYDGGDAPPTQIELPPLTADSLRALKPNVAVKVPPELQQHMDRIDLGNLLDGKHTKTGLDWGMICGFSIPIITICAFIILQIFLQLLNIIFWWLPFVRICIPYPKPTTEEE
ncbi:MAG: hypothetical protein ABJL99_03420 [Aliishimia sp.]